MRGMLRRPGTALALLAAVLVTGTDVVSQRQTPAAGSVEPAPPAVARSPRNANYSIDVELDPASRTVTGRSVVSWRNISGRPTSELQFHLYWNAWRNTDSTWMRERIRAGRGPGGPMRHACDGRPTTGAHRHQGDSTGRRRRRADDRPDHRGTFIAPDDGNQDDQTVLSVPLPGAVAPGSRYGGTRWTAHVPRTFARTGAIGNYFFIAQWFPKLGVLEEDGWNTHQFHASTEFYADYGVYDVRITVPRGWAVGATGRERERHDTPKGKTTISTSRKTSTTSPGRPARTTSRTRPGSRTPRCRTDAAPAAARARGAGRTPFRRGACDAR